MPIIGVKFIVEFLQDDGNWLNGFQTDKEASALDHFNRCKNTEEFKDKVRLKKVETTWTT